MLIQQTISSLLLLQSTVVFAYPHYSPPGNDPYSDIPYEEEKLPPKTQKGEWIPTILDKTVVDIYPKDMMQVTETKLTPAIYKPSVNELRVRACENRQILVNSSQTERFSYYTCENSSYMNLRCLTNGEALKESMVEIGDYFDQPVYAVVGECQ